MELRIDGTAVLRSIIREPPYIGAFQVGPADEEEVQARIGRALEAGSRVELAFVD